MHTSLIKTIYIELCIRLKSKQLKLNYAYVFNQNNLSSVMRTSLIKAIYIE